jgi:predicted RNase H-like HicB family nuclease
MLRAYIQAALKHAEYRKLQDGTWFAEIAGYAGVWANAGTVEECRQDLAEVLEEWLLLKIRDRDTLPIVDGIEIAFRQEALV